jgi:hypothetical protein
MATKVKTMVTVEGVTRALEGKGKNAKKTEVNGFLNVLALMGLAVKSQVPKGDVKKKGKPTNQFEVEGEVLVKFEELMG